MCEFGHEAFLSESKDNEEAERTIPQQIVNCDETCLFWKKMPKSTFFTQEEKTLPEHKPMKDSLSLLLCEEESKDYVEAERTIP
ncbi:hypothetical protein AVEN_98696-1 [Araneus ventricosus]|uniref:Uncharacterized protein n=1 Tax=Araneus ventricosus TaxID=182803 RepID=A0A4Y2VUI8_ARAVE|nr:hypothetical protein AVEN_98696-1 [Araneus ventricosus]